MARRNNKENISTVNWDGNLLPFIKDMPIGDKVWFYGCSLKETDQTATITAPTLGMAEEIKGRFGNKISSWLHKNITYQWENDGPKDDCKIGHINRLKRINPHLEYTKPDSCNCYKCTGFKLLDGDI